ncbi:hypothetical protein [Echinicola shivajiensis]|uniref:hypothetical protein n=1 Tax=Echinicola shivajiensis TaxID=1035916 RepID=UPI001BFC49E9|nr:hypothetical protein [Echinicola shivajiensis]
MKTNLITLLLIFCTVTTLIAQEKEKRGFISISLGPSVNLGNNQSHYLTIHGPSGQIIGKSDDNNSIPAGNIGLNLNLIEAGYVFKFGLGFTGKWQGGAYIKNQGDTEITGSFGAILLGPMYMLHINDQLDLDIKARVGRMYYSEEASSSASESYYLGGDFGAALRFHIAKKWSLLTGIDYQTGLNISNINRINTSFGVAFRY